MRLNKIDELRALTLISMCLYHFCWDLKFLAGLDMDWYTGIIGKVWQQSICITFILISGFCFLLSKKRIKRSLTVFLCGMLITAVTVLIMPQNRVVFGILTFLGTAELLTVLVNKFVSKKRFSNVCLFAVCFVFFLVFYNINGQSINLFFTQITMPEALYHGYVNTFLGFMDKSFFSTDYFSLLPWYFLYLCGYFLYGFYEEHKKPAEDFLSKRTCRPLSFIGRHSLIIYMLHQPVLLCLTLLIKAILKI